VLNGLDSAATYSGWQPVITDIGSLYEHQPPVISVIGCSLLVISAACYYDIGHPL